MALLHFRSIERRRTVRAAMSMQLLVQGKSESGKQFRIETRTLMVSKHGGLMLVEIPMEVGQRLHLTNEHSGKKAEARVVLVKQDRNGQREVAFEFVEGGEKFWNMVFPAAGAKPLRRVGARREAIG